MAHEQLGPFSRRFLHDTSESELDAEMLVVRLGPRSDGISVRFADLRERVEERIHLVPRFRKKVVDAPLRMAPPLLVDDPSFEPSAHLEVVELPDGEPNAALDQLLADFLAEPVDLDRPPWAIRFVPDLPDGGTAVIAKVNHVMMGGVGGMASAGLLLVDTDDDELPDDDGIRDPLPSMPERVGIVFRYHGGRAAQLGKDVGDFIRDPVGRGSALIRGVGGLRAAIRELTVTPSELPLKQPASAHKAVRTLDVSTADLEAIIASQTVHTTVNDVVLTALGGGLRQWLISRGLPLTSFEVFEPVSLDLHEGGQDLYDSRVSLMIVDLDLEEADDQARLRALRAEIRHRKEAGNEGVADVFTFLSWLPWLRFWPQNYDFAVSNMPGPSTKVTILGAAIEGAYGLAQVHGGHSFRCVAVSLSGRFGLGMSYDPDVIEGVDAIVEGFEATVDLLKPA